VEKKNPTACLESSRHTRAEKQKEAWYQGEACSDGKTKKSSHNFFAKSTVSQMPVAVTLGICFFFYRRSNATHLYLSKTQFFLLNED